MEVCRYIRKGTVPFITWGIFFFGFFPMVSYGSDGRLPNVIIILADDMGYADAGFNGCEDIPTPAMDSIVANGIRFTQGYVTSPQCAPSRSGLLTGRDQNKIGCNNNMVLDVAGLTDGPTIADHMRGAGYRTGMVGKWHLGTVSGKHPMDPDQFQTGLYNLKEDIGESKDLSAIYPEIRQSLQDGYDAWRTKLPEPFSALDVVAINAYTQDKREAALRRRQ